MARSLAPGDRAGGDGGDAAEPPGLLAAGALPASSRATAQPPPSSLHPSPPPAAGCHTPPASATDSPTSTVAAGADHPHPTLHPSSARPPSTAASPLPALSARPRLEARSAGNATLRAGTPCHPGSTFQDHLLRDFYTTAVPGDIVPNHPVPLWVTPASNDPRYNLCLCQEHA
ncbi:pectinesterase inhibitor 10-like [Panicum virgatum]|uniref:pectinesterase inhibitor 10-like n=1 Tax=Panicum virgatum TaxID=38727 RepID=UPI0019D64F4E|nr:pectinesterase inhibitor 10-like [Panicum virgatum]